MYPPTTIKIRNCLFAHQTRTSLCHVEFTNRNINTFKTNELRIIIQDPEKKKTIMYIYIYIDINVHMQVLYVCIYIYIHAVCVCVFYVAHAFCGCGVVVRPHVRPMRLAVVGKLLGLQMGWGGDKGGVAPPGPMAVRNAWLCLVRRP